MNRVLVAGGMACLALPAVAATPLNSPADVAAIKTFEQTNAERLDPTLWPRPMRPTLS